MKKSLVVFYSWGGNTKEVAKYLSQKLGADLLELIPEKPYPNDYNTCVRQVGSDGRTYKPKLVNTIPDLFAYDTIFIGSPCWWGSIANPIRTFLHQNDFSDKILVPFMTHGTSGLHVEDVKLLCPDAKVLDGVGIFNSYQVSTTKNTPKNMGEYQKSIDQWLEKIGL